MFITQYNKKSNLLGVSFNWIFLNIISHLQNILDARSILFIVANQGNVTACYEDIKSLMNVKLFTDSSHKRDPLPVTYLTSYFGIIIH